MREDLGIWGCGWEGTNVQLRRMGWERLRGMESFSMVSIASVVYVQSSKSLQVVQCFTKVL
jgi:hypothetical protein